MMQAREFQFSERDFRFLADLVGAQTGIVLGENKRDMVYGRLAKRLRQLSLKSFREYCSLLDAPGGKKEMRHFINALTTNHTGFFREPHHFTELERRLAELAARPGKTRIRLWSAAASIGAEAYSMAMCALDALPDASQLDLKILATDIDTNVLVKARSGGYSASMAAAIPADKRARYTRRVADDMFEVAPALKELVVFKPLNLLDDWPMSGLFDIVFCRNVVIYFDKPTQAKLFNRFADQMTLGGWLFIGHSETLFNICDRFELAGKTLYRRVR